MQSGKSDLPNRLSIHAPVSCAQCGETLPLPEWSEEVDECKVRHFWICAACDYTFETLVKFPALARAA